MAMSKEAMEAFKKENDRNQESEQKIILKGYEQIKKGQVRTIDEVFDRLEKKYEV